MIKKLATIGAAAAIFAASAMPVFAQGIDAPPPPTEEQTIVFVCEKAAVAVGILNPDDGVECGK